MLGCMGQNGDERCDADASSHQQKRPAHILLLKIEISPNLNLYHISHACLSRPGACQSQETSSVMAQTHCRAARLIPFKARSCMIESILVTTWLLCAIIARSYCGHLASRCIRVQKPAPGNGMKACQPPLFRSIACPCCSFHSPAKPVHG